MISSVVIAAAVTMTLSLKVTKSFAVTLLGTKDESTSLCWNILFKNYTVHSTFLLRDVLAREMPEILEAAVFL